MKILSYVGILVMVGLVTYGGWQVTRMWNYAWSYEDMVQETVCEMVKPEHLIEPCP